MNDAIKMQISAFVDGELPQAETELLVKRLGQDNTLRKKAAEYVAIGGLLRGEPAVAGLAELPDRVAAALAAEPALENAAAARKPGGWMRPAAGVAIAASVALLALAGLRQLDTPDVDSAVQTAEVPASYTEPLAIDVLADWPGERLTQYYLSHGETSGEFGANGILSRLVTLELRGGELVEVAPAADETLEPATQAGDNDDSGDTQDSAQ